MNRGRPRPSGGTREQCPPSGSTMVRNPNPLRYHPAASPHISSTSPEKTPGRPLNDAHPPARPRAPGLPRNAALGQSELASGDPSPLRLSECASHDPLSRPPPGPSPVRWVRRPLLSTRSRLRPRLAPGPTRAAVCRFFRRPRQFSVGLPNPSPRRSTGVFLRLSDLRRNPCPAGRARRPVGR